MRAASALIAAAISISASALGVGVAACGATPAGPPVGMSDAVPERSPPERPEPARAPWPDLEAARAWPEAAPAMPALGHRRDGTRLHVRVEPPGLEPYRQLSVESPMPNDARVVAFHESKSGQFLGAYVLEKRGGAWAAHEVDAKGALVPGDRAACLRCHEMAPTDHLFGVQAPPPAPPVGESIVTPPR